VDLVLECWRVVLELEEFGLKYFGKDASLSLHTYTHIEKEESANTEGNSVLCHTQNSSFQLNF